jgi:hypothetical protein
MTRSGSSTVIAWRDDDDALQKRGMNPHPDVVVKLSRLNNARVAVA